MEMNRSTHRKCEISKRHKVAQDLKKKSACVLQSWGDNMRRIESLSSKGTFYIIQGLKNKSNCPLCCSACKACTHMYSCTCLDATDNSTVCIHVHSLCMQIQDRIQHQSNNFECDEIDSETETIDNKEDVHVEEDSDDG